MRRDGGEKWEEGWGCEWGRIQPQGRGTAGQGVSREEDGIRRQEWMLLGETLYSFPKSYLPSMGRALTAKGSSQFQLEKRRLPGDTVWSQMPGMQAA